MYTEKEFIPNLTVYEPYDPNGTSLVQDDDTVKTLPPEFAGTIRKGEETSQARLDRFVAIQRVAAVVGELATPGMSIAELNNKAGDRWRDITEQITGETPHDKVDELQQKAEPYRQIYSILSLKPGRVILPRIDGKTFDPGDLMDYCVAKSIPLSGKVEDFHTNLMETAMRAAVDVESGLEKAKKSMPHPNRRNAISRIFNKKPVNPYQMAIEQAVERGEAPNPFEYAQYYIPHDNAFLNEYDPQNQKVEQLLADLPPEFREKKEGFVRVKKTTPLEVEGSPTVLAGIFVKAKAELYAAITKNGAVAMTRDGTTVTYEGTESFGTFVISYSKCDEVPARKTVVDDDEIMKLEQPVFQPRSGTAEYETARGDIIHRLDMVLGLGLLYGVDLKTVVTDAPKAA